MRARLAGPTGSLWDPIDIQRSCRSPSSFSSFYPASEESATAWSSFNGKISKTRGTSEWLFDVASRLCEQALLPSGLLYYAFHHLSPLLVPALVRLFSPFLFFFFLSLTFLSLWPFALTYMCAAKVSRLRSFYFLPSRAIGKFADKAR